MLKFCKFIPVAAALLVLSTPVLAQCSICTKTAQQLGKDSAEGLNSGIVYLMVLPFAIGGFIAYRWWQHEKAGTAQTENQNGA